MKFIRTWLHTILMNLLVLLLLVAMVILLPPALFDLYRWMNVAPDSRASLPNYKDIGWAKKHFEEFSSLRTVYQDFIGWRRAGFDGETITVDKNGYRRHPNSVQPDNAEVWVFGGSTIWGPGVKDSMTIPANIQRFASKSSFNFGEAAYTAHQSYNLLIKNYLLGGRPKHVVFYDGANEVVIKCRSELTFFSAAQEATIRKRLQGLSDGRSTTLEAFAPTVDVLRRFSGWLGRSPSSAAPDTYDCHTNEAKRKLVAAALVLDWSLARKLVEQNGGTFIPVLQPIAYTGQPNLDHLDSVRRDSLLRSQYESVYAEIVRQLRAAGSQYADFTDVFDAESHLYIDFAHVSPQGNEIVGKRIAALLK